MYVEKEIAMISRPLEGDTMTASNYRKNFVSKDGMKNVPLKLLINSTTTKEDAKGQQITDQDFLPCHLKPHPF